MDLGLQNLLKQHYTGTVRVCCFENKEKLLFVMDNDPSQNSRVAKDALQEIGAELVKIPPRSPDLNPIENVFHNVKRKILKEALQERIKKEDFTAFKERVLQTLANCSGSLIDGTIKTMHKRLKTITTNGGYRTKY